MVEYVLVFLVTAAVTYLLVPLVRRVAVRTRAIHEPRARDTHTAPTPLLGGLAMYGGLVAGLLVATYVAVEAPVSGMSMNPARTLASALPAGIWTDLWIYFTAPVLGMQVAGWTMTWRATPAPGCAKLLHSPEHRCIHCGHRPAGTGQRSSSFPERLQ